jgi:glycosyltransferase involved in cell wall biosynthesis
MRKQVHLINPLWDATGGSEWRTLTLFSELKASCNVQLWSEANAAIQLREQFPVRQIVTQRGSFPKTGTFVFVGAYYHVGRWMHFTFPRRIILIYNTPTPHLFTQTLRKLSVWGRKVEVVYASDYMRSIMSYAGVVQPSPIDIDRFSPSLRQTTDHTTDNSEDKFVIGRLSRDVAEKHNSSDPELYRALAAEGCHSIIMGGTCLLPELEDAPLVQLLPAGAEEAHRFLQRLDCFFYRTAEDYIEPFGRVVLEAMACGLPVVCHRRGGYADVIDDGHNGFLFDTQEEALNILLRLKTDRRLRASIGQAARKTAESLFGAEGRRKMIEFYLR